MEIATVENKRKTAGEIQDWLVAYLAEFLDIQQQEIDIKRDFDSYGLDSSAAVVLTGDLEKWLGREIYPTLLYDRPNIEALVQHLTEQK